MFEARGGRTRVWDEGVDPRDRCGVRGRIGDGRTSRYHAGMASTRSSSPQPRRSVAERRRDLAALPDEELCGHCAAGDRLAWEALVNRYQRLVYAVPLRAGIRDDEAEEVFHRTFVKLSEHVASLRERGRVRAWVVTTARRLTIDVLRARKTRPVADDPEAVFEQLADPSPGADQQLADLERRHLVRQAVGLLEERCQRLIHLLFYEATDPPRPYEALAAELGMPVGSLGPTRARCLQKLLKALRTLEGE